MADPELGVHEKGSFHGQTPDPEPPSPRRDGPEVPVEGVPVPNPVANLTISPATVAIPFPSARDPAPEVLQLRVVVPKC